MLHIITIILFQSQLGDAYWLFLPGVLSKRPARPTLAAALALIFNKWASNEARKKGEPGKELSLENIKRTKRGVI